MKAIAAMRNQFGGHAVRTGAAGRRRTPTLRLTESVYVSHLSLHNFRCVRRGGGRARSPGVTAFIGRNGQGKTNLVEAIDYLVPARARTGSPSDAPLPCAHGAEPGRRARRGGPRRRGPRCSRCELSRPGRTALGSTARRCRGRASIVGLVRTVVFSPEDLTLVKGDPSDRRRSSTTCWCCAHRGWPACAPTTTGSSSSATRCSRPAPRAHRRARCARPSACGTTTSPSTGAELLAERLALVDALRPYLGQGLRDGRARGDHATTRTSSTAASFDLEGRTHARSSAESLLAEVERPPHRRARPRHLAGRAAPRRALLTLGHGPGECPAGQGLRLARGVVVVRARAAAGVVRPAARRRRRPDPDPRRRLRRARHRAARPAGRPGRRGRAGARDRGRRAPTCPPRSPGPATW